GSSDKTEKPTAKRLKEARDRGQVARSRDLTIAASSLAATAALGSFGYRYIQNLGGAVAETLNHFANAPLHEIRSEELVHLLERGGFQPAMVVGPIAIVALITGVFTAFTQGGFNFATEALHLNWNQLSPATGFARFAPMRAGIDTLKSMLSAIVLFA